MPFVDNSAQTNWKFIWIVAILAVLVGGGALLYKDSTSEGGSLLQKGEQESDTQVAEKSEEPQESQEPEPRAPAPVQKTSQWQTYQNLESGFEIRYPTDWSRTTNTDGFMIKLKNPTADAYIGVAQAGGHGIPGKWTDALTGYKTFEGSTPSYVTIDDFLIITYGIVSRADDLQEIFATFRSLEAVGKIACEEAGGTYVGCPVNPSPNAGLCIPCECPQGFTWSLSERACEAL